MFKEKKFLDAGIQDVSTSISIVHDLIERYPDDDDDESDKHLEARDRRYSCLICEDSLCPIIGQQGHTVIRNRKL